MEALLKQLVEIDNMYIVNVTNGYYLPTGSFIATDDKGNEYFAYVSIVKKHQNVFDSLIKKEAAFWILGEKRNWGPKWDNEERISIQTISKNKADCQDFKNYLFFKLMTMLNLVKLQQMRHEAINVDNINSKIPFSDEVEILQKI